MTLVLGIDGGNHGAFAVYDAASGRIVGAIQDMPLWFQTVGKKKRQRVDALALADMMDMFDTIGIGLAVLEAVGGRPRQSASAAFVFGYGIGLIYMSLLYAKIPIETVPPGTWKKIMNVPGKTKADDSAILARADELFPHDRSQWRGERGGKKVDRAEAAMLAKFGADHVLRTMGQVTDQELRLAYQKADTGA